MKRRFALLTVLAALAALAVPASSMAGISPAGHKFEIGASGGPTLKTSLGSCDLVKITGQIPAAPANEGASVVFPIPTPTVGNCTAGTSVTLSGEWKVSVGGYLFNVFGYNNPEAVVMRFSSLPGCKLSGVFVLNGYWSNGIAGAKFMKSGMQPRLARAATWANDGGNCALAGKTEMLSYGNSSYGTSIESGGVLPVTDLTSPTTPIIVGP